jgi:hypothetical protein
MSNNWFEVDTKGLKALQEGKPKTFIVRELLQNAFDEDITSCKLNMSWDQGVATISVEDDSPEGFRDLSDAYTLFKDTYKRADATKRGRFNLGEKQVFSVCLRAEIITTTGTIVFDNDGRRKSRVKRDRGSNIRVVVRITRAEFDDIIAFVQLLLVPKHVKFEFFYKYGVEDGPSVNSGGKFFYYAEPHKSFDATLRTELKDGEAFRPTRRKTTVNIHKTEDQKYLYELGIPVCEIECDFSIDVQQKVPLSTDRDTVSAAFLKELYALVLNHTHESITSENAASAWVREAVSSPLVEKEAVRSMVFGRFGDKVVVANPSDPVANDDAIARGYHVVRGSELNREEWDNIRKFEAMPSSTQMFGKTNVDYQVVEPTNEQKKVADWAKKFFREFFHDTLHVKFISSKASMVADFEHQGNKMRFNVPNVFGPWSADGRPSKGMIDLIIHEFGHRKGHHTQSAYHEALTSMGAWLAIKALNDPKWFDL